MFVEACAQVAYFSQSRRFSGGDGDIDRRQCVLVQAKGFSCEAFDAIAGDGCAERAGRDAQTQTRIGFMIAQNRQTKKRIGEFFAAPPDISKFGRLMQTLARLERQFTDR
jgi:hypothetical protein